MALQFIVGLRNSLADAITAAIDAGAGAGILAIYSGTKPATVATALSGNTLLAKIPLNDPSFAAASGGAIALDVSPTIQDASADATDTATWFRVYSSADGSTISEANAVMQGTVTATGGGGDIEVTSTSFVATEPITITAGTITSPGA